MSGPVARRRILVGGLTLAFGLAAGRVSPAASKAAVTVHKSPTCGCCTGWVEHVRAAGYPVKAVDVDDLTPIKQRLGVPSSLQSCHTAEVGGYVIEGHVPADLIDRLLRERPTIIGLVVPDMPVGSPGMEIPGRPADRYEVFAFDRRGRTTVFARR